jgi:hypothetical protein
VLQDSVVQVVPKEKFQENKGNQLVEDIARMPAPPRGLFSQNYLMPMRFGVDSCDRDFGASCPEKWVSIGAIFGDGKNQCSASFEYDGPCGSDVYAFDSVSSLGRLRWSNMCRVLHSIAARQPVGNGKPMRVLVVRSSRFRGLAFVPAIHIRR